jgi:fluoroquinolone resistance protein
VTDVADRQHGHPTPETTTKVISEDWSRDDLAGRTAAQVEYVRVDLAETTSTGGLVFEGCVFRDAGFNLSEHTGAAFVNCTFTGCDFFGAKFNDCKFVGSTFDRCTFDQLTVDGGDWSFVGLPGADLHAAAFEGVRMRETDLTGVNAKGGVLRKCDLSASMLNRAQLDRCDLRGSDVSAIDPWNVSLRAAVITWEQAVVLAAAMGLDVRPD